MKLLASGNPCVMLLGGARVFYNGYAGETGGQRRLGAFAIYAAPLGRLELSVAGAPARHCQAAAVPAFVPHRVRSECGLISTILIEPESVSGGELDDLERRLSAPDGQRDLLRRLSAARRRLLQAPPGEGFLSSDFDELFLGRVPEPRQLDARVRRVLQHFLNGPPDPAMTARDCASEAGLSRSRYLHLFSQETGMPFRSCRMWKRARSFLPHVNGGRSLTEVALDLGYPDSTHFSHSIRRVYGLTPSAIFRGSRALRIVRGAGVAAAGMDARRCAA